MCGHNPGDWGRKYWQAMNAYDKSYTGVSASDFINCWVAWDDQGLDFRETPGAAAAQDANRA